MNILSRITEYREARNWSEYELSERSALSQSTISSWYSKNILPSISSLEKICNAFGITMAEFFSETDVLIASQEQRELIELWNTMTESQQQRLLEFLKTIRSGKTG